MANVIPNSHIEATLLEMFPIFPKEYLQNVLNQTNRDLFSAVQICAQQKAQLMQLYASNPAVAAAGLQNLMLSSLNQGLGNNFYANSFSNSQIDPYPNQAVRLSLVPGFPLTGNMENSSSYPNRSNTTHSIFNDSSRLPFSSSAHTEKSSWSISFFIFSCFHLYKF